MLPLKGLELNLTPQLEKGSQSMKNLISLII